MVRLLSRPPDCGCPDPSPVPEGYLKSESGWHCAPGFIGHAVKSCNSTRSCSSPRRASKNKVRKAKYKGKSLYKAYKRLKVSL